ncbi:MAG: ubiquinone biosynthesis protein COQ4 [Myxococcales bacterium]|nr:ubiquinone biosynthesis protein COQ4 [Myxococcales bacterium]
MSAFSALHRSRRALRAGLHTFRFHDFGSNLASLQDGVDVETFERLAAAYADDPRWHVLLDRRPRFQKETVDLDALADLPDGTLGRELLRHLVDHDLLGGERHPVCPYPASDEAAYAKIRWRETHDVRHVLTGLDTSIHDEILLQAFQHGQFFNWFAVSTVAFGPFMDPRRCLSPGMAHRCWRACRAGRRALPLFVVFWEDLYDRRVDELRHKFGVERIGPRP